MTAFQIIVVVIAAIAAASDVTTRKIPNALTFGAALIGMVAHAYLEGWPGAGVSAAGWLVGIAAFFPFFALGGLGAGDIKLLGAIGAWLGPVAAIWVALFSAMAGGVLALIVAASAGYLRRALGNLWVALMSWRIVGFQPMPELTLAGNSGPRLAYAVPMLAGLVVTLWLR